MPASQAQQFDTISVRGVFGYFFEALEQNTGAAWMGDISNTFQSNQDIETYAGLGMSPTMREWIGAKQVKNLKELFVQIPNRDFEATLRFKNKDLRRDKTGQVRARIGDFAQRALSHDALVMSAIVDGGTSSSISIPGGSSQTIKCYDGQPLWSASHTIGSQALNNIVAPSIATAATYLGTNVGTGSTTNPSPAMMSYSIQLGLNALYGFKDDQGQPLNEFAKNFVIMTNVAMAGAATAATQGAYLGVGYTNPLNYAKNPSENTPMFRVVPNPRLAGTTQFYIFRTDGSFKPLIRQFEELTPDSADEAGYGETADGGVGMGIVMKALAEGSDNEFFNNETLFSIEKSAGFGIGRFDQAVQVAIAS
jgi:hypothetical protein